MWFEGDCSSSQDADGIIMGHRKTRVNPILRKVNTTNATRQWLHIMLLLCSKICIKREVTAKGGIGKGAWTP